MGRWQSNALIRRPFAWRSRVVKWTIHAIAQTALVCLAAWSALGSLPPAVAREHSDSDARYIHHIHLYDGDFRKISPASTTPYSPLKTCGRCHDYEQISHGWHFNAFDTGVAAGRPGEPWIWTDVRTGTQLPLSYRDPSTAYSPASIGVAAWEMTWQFGDRLPGGNMGIAPATGGRSQQTQEIERTDQVSPQRWSLSGSLEIDCLICHAVPGSYDFNARRKQIRDQNFAWAPTAGLRLGQIEGRVSRIKDGAEQESESRKEDLPKVAYAAGRFSADGTVFIDLVRQPANNACFQCHSRRVASDAGIQPHWMADEDVHLRAGMQCVDCHRNGIDHLIVRGFEGEQHPAGQEIGTLSCAGCHLGTDPGANVRNDILRRAGRMGSPYPAHAGLPPIHFQKLSCTACHSGPVPRADAARVLTSLAHGLGEPSERNGLELPAILGPVYLRDHAGRISPSLVTWPAFWGVLVDGQVTPLPPDRTHALVRRQLRARKGFAEILNPKLSAAELRQILGDERGTARPETWNERSRAMVGEAQAARGRELFNQRVYAALDTIENELGVEQAVYVSSGKVYARGPQQDDLKQVDHDDRRAVQMVSWPIAHPVRPAGWSLGVAGCTECHTEDARLFASTVAAIGPGPDNGQAISMASLQGIDPAERAAWNALFSGRKFFKYVLAVSIAALIMTLLVGIGACSARWVGSAE